MKTGFFTRGTGAENTKEKIQAVLYVNLELLTIWKVGKIASCT
jgi:hypothetical protein